MTSVTNANALLIIDDEPDVGAFIQDVAEEAGFSAVVVSTFKGFQEVYDPKAFSGLLLDLQMPDKDGLEYLRLLSETGCRADIVVMSGYDARVLGAANRFGKEAGLRMAGVLQKPIRMDDLSVLLTRIQSDSKTITISDIETAISDWQFAFDFQPKARLTASDPGKKAGHTLSLRSGSYQLDSFEALIRWQHPVYGMLSPDLFIPMIETSNLVHLFSYKVVENVLHQSAVWRESGFDPVIAVNLPAHLAVDSAVPDRISELAEAKGVSHDSIVLEVTETAAMENAVQAMSVLSRLRLRNFRLAMDDFGTGYSSLVQLHKMPFNELKIDKSIVFELGVNKDADTIVRSIIDLAHNLGLEVCAEGVETAEALALLKSFGCDTAQGFYLSRPVNPDAAQALCGFQLADEPDTRKTRLSNS